jgi:DNA-binding FadR family transcriptional regulator
VLESDSGLADATGALRAPRRAYEAVAAELEVLIRGGHLAVGDRLPSERQLASQFRVSRPTIRVAIGQLEARGLVATKSNSGTYVVERDAAPVVDAGGDESPAEVLETRLVVEVAAARLAARRASAEREGLEDVRLAVEALERAADPEELHVDIDVDFHRSVVALTGNTYLCQVVAPIWRTMDQALLATLLRRNWKVEDTIRTASEHRAIYEALRVGDAELAAFAMERHIRALIAAIFEDGPFDGPPPRYYA